MKDIVSPSELYFSENGTIANNPRLPVLVYRKVLGQRIANKDKKFQHLFEENGWMGIWISGLYDYHHYHSTSHEVLGFAGGEAEVQLGGEGGKTLVLAAGDMIVLPAGTGHRKLSGSENLVVVGAYPAGQQDYDICRGSQEQPIALEKIIAAVPLPKKDPFYGDMGPLLSLWQKSA